MRAAYLLWPLMSMALSILLIWSGYWSLTHLKGSNNIRKTILHSLFLLVRERKGCYLFLEKRGRLVDDSTMSVLWQMSRKFVSFGTREFSKRERLSVRVMNFSLKQVWTKLRGYHEKDCHWLWTLPSWSSIWACRYFPDTSWTPNFWWRFVHVYRYTGWTDAKGTGNPFSVRYVEIILLRFQEHSIAHRMYFSFRPHVKLPVVLWQEYTQ